MAESHFKTSNVRFDPEEIRLLSGDHGTLAGTPYGGVRYPWEKTVLDPDAAGYFLHPGGMRAMSILGTRPPPGSEADLGVFWEPPPGWNKSGGLLRRPRVMLILGNDFFLPARLTALFEELGPLGVTIAVSQRAFASARPLAAILPAVGLGTENLGPFALSGDFRRFRPTYATGPFVGGDIMVVELNPYNWRYGGLTSGQEPAVGNAAYAQYVFTSVGIPAPDPAPGGAVYFPAPPDPSDPFTEDRIVAVFPGEAAIDAVAVKPLVDGCRSYEHRVYHLDRADDGGTTIPDGTAVDHGGIYAALYGGVPWATRRLMPPDDLDGLWAQIRLDALAFFE